ncbi:hypothetical protein [Anabaena lutea]|nr:hypothetical protein [Anabaena lutea]
MKRKKVKWAVWCPGGKNHWKTFFENCHVEAWHKAKKLSGGLPFRLFPVE